jgi:transcriptional regulator with XRE-family HTH domain
MSSGKFNPLPRTIREPASLALGGIIREWRLRRGWTLGKLADVSGIKRHGIFLIETSQRLARVETAERIGRALGVPGSELLRLAERRAARWPAQCQECNYCCIESGRLKWWNARRGCLRPKH